LKSKSFCRQEYQSKLYQRFDPYSKWIERKEAGAPALQESKLSLRLLPMETCVGDWNLAEVEEDIVLLYAPDGILSDHAKDYILDYFETHEKTALVYADEDILVEKGQFGDANPDILHQVGIDVDHKNPAYSGRIAPWYKPEYSMDTLLSFSYFGNVVAVRTNALRSMQLQYLSTADYHLNLYDFYLQVSEQGSIGHLSKVLFHRKGLPVELLPAGAGETYRAVKETALIRRNLAGKVVTDGEGYTHIQYGTKANPLVSIIIPSKDHPGLLGTCISSLKEHTDYSNYEVIVVDNGSNEENQKSILALQEAYGFTYLYEERPFNFSLMCNQGASAAKGELLLFLNDDIEILQDNWLTLCVGQALLAHTGAVGVKLLYPGGELIQHAGVSNSLMGPFHRLQHCKDDVSMYYGRNRMEYNVLAVTAAAVLMRKELFYQVQGFCQELVVAYNDVDLCMKLYEAGYVNVIRNDVCLIHHESVSRGSDANGENRKRLDREREKLYAMHPQFAPSASTDVNEIEDQVMDPYCHHTECWKTNSLFMTGYLFDHENKAVMTPLYEVASKKYRKQDQGIRVSRRKLRKPTKRYLDRTLVWLNMDRQTNLGDVVEIEGWGFATKRDNALFQKLILFQREDGLLYVAHPLEALRDDVSQSIEGQCNILLCGFVVRFSREELPAGRYQIGCLLQHQVTGKAYVEYSQEFLQI